MNSWNVHCTLYTSLQFLCAHTTHMHPPQTVKTQKVIVAREVHVELAAAIPYPYFICTSYCGKFTSHISPSEQLLSLHFPIRILYYLAQNKNENCTIEFESTKKRPQKTVFSIRLRAVNL